MALTSAQIVTLATQIAKVPGMVSQAGMFLNMMLADLCQTYDFEVARGNFSFNFNPGLIAPPPTNVTPGGGPYPLPADFLRMNKRDCYWTLLGVPYPMIPVDLYEFDLTVQQAGLQSYPYWFTTDVSQSPPVMYVYVPPSGAYPVFGRYQRQMPDIATPQTSSTVPWFPNQNYLITRLSGELMRLAGDDRWEAFLGDGPDHPSGAENILRKYLKEQGDNDDRAKHVDLDRRRFGSNFPSLPNTKSVGWALAIVFVQCLSSLIC